MHDKIDRNMREIVNILENIVNHPETEISIPGLFDLSRDEFISYFRDSTTYRRIVNITDVDISPKLLCQFVEKLRNYFQGFVNLNSDEIGTAKVISSNNIIPLKQFAKSLIEASLLITPEKVVSLLEDWKNGLPLTYQEFVHLVGINVDAPIKISDGIQLMSPNDPIQMFPEWTGIDTILAHPHTPKNYGSILILDWIESPVFYNPIYSKSSHTNRTINNTLDGLNVTEFSRDRFCNCLSLCCNNYVYPMFSWINNGDIAAFQIKSELYNKYTAPPTLFHKNVTNEELKKLIPVVKSYHDVNVKEITGFDISISRWSQSLRNDVSISDKCIDLRIALEALYLTENQTSELKYRLATRVAWHIGENQNERLSVLKTINDFYNQSSKIIHAKNSDKVTLEIVQSVQDILKNGIMKRLTGQKNIEWDKLILGFY